MDIQPLEPELCAQCAAPRGKNLKKCSRCKIVAYCSTECQHEHWKGHKMLCVALPIEATKTEVGAASASQESSTLTKSSSIDPGPKSKKIVACTEEECANCAAVGCPGSITLSKCSKCLMVAYCSRACQVQHWKDGGHKKFCISPAERATLVPPEKKTASSLLTSAVEDPIRKKKAQDCAICSDNLIASNASMLPCGHSFHAVCLKNVRKFSVSQSCPLCRAPLPSGDTTPNRGPFALCHAALNNVSFATLKSLAPSARFRHWCQRRHQSVVQSGLCRKRRSREEADGQGRCRQRR